MLILSSKSKHERSHGFLFCSTALLLSRFYCSLSLSKIAFTFHAKIIAGTETIIVTPTITP